MVKRIGKLILAFFMTVVVCLLFYCFFGGALCNDLRALRLEKAYSSMELPEGVVRLETASFVGNTSGAGNLTEIWAIRSLPPVSCGCFLTGMKYGKFRRTGMEITGVRRCIWNFRHCAGNMQGTDISWLAAFMMRLRRWICGDIKSLRAFYEMKTGSPVHHPCNKRSR